MVRLDFVNLASDANRPRPRRRAYRKGRMTSNEKKPSLGEAIDKVVEALAGLEPSVAMNAIRAATEHLGLRAVEPATDTAVTNAAKATKDESAAEAGSDIRTLREAKQPKTAQEMACIVAYYLKLVAPKDERKLSIDATDIETYFTQANFEVPKRTAQLLVDAKASGYFDSADKGKYKLNAVGQNLVTHRLPRAKAKQ